MWETVIDVAFLGLSIKEYLNNPSTETFLYVVWDGVATIMPYVPGSYVARGMNLATKSEISAELAKQGIRFGAVSSKTAKSGTKRVISKSLKKNTGRYKKAKSVVNKIETIKSNLGRNINITKCKIHSTVVGAKSVKPTGIANSSVDIISSDGKLLTRRWYDKNGRAYKDVDFTNHGNPKNHPEYPHEHIWKWDNGKACRI